MTDTPGSTAPFPGFPGFPPAEMLERMWGMMRLSPFGSAFSGAQPGGGGLGPSLSMMSDMMAPLTNVEELDKRITDMRAVEQWLKLNLSMLQSAIQALEVQRATLATLRAFGAFAQSSMAQPAESAAPSPAPATGWPHPAAPAPAPAPAASANAASSAEAPAGGEEEAPGTPSFDASAWWNLLQSQFNQIAQFAMTQPPAVGAGAEASDFVPDDAEASAAGGETAADAPPAPPQDAESAARRPAAKRAPVAAKRTSGASASPKATKKSI
ncbi:PhaM family polyhydroxyalkanoate granule multifunctional regulatory protein [Paraburkholderia xenovorans]|uniref:PhaM family polyhydroxyalkanoate granule multifunctional regulatory protein n=1 Tax=Paraburkholderia xenovorans TaxID=36873 RepID=UPI0038BD5DD5